MGSGGRHRRGGGADRYGTTLRPVRWNIREPASRDSTEEAKVADRKRRGEDAVDERLDEALDEDALTEDLDEEDLLDDEEEDLLEEDDAEEVPARARGRQSTATKPKTAAAGKKKSPPGRKATKTKETERRGPIGRIVNFVREVVAELRKVIWPTRKELLTYTTVVVIFVSIMIAITAGLDVAFAKLVLLVFGGGTTSGAEGQ
jgi:preprotein translocase subunit SecE